MGAGRYGARPLFLINFHLSKSVFFIRLRWLMFFPCKIFEHLRIESRACVYVVSRPFLVSFMTGLVNWVIKSCRAQKAYFALVDTVFEALLVHKAWHQPVVRSVVVRKLTQTLEQTFTDDFGPSFPPVLQVAWGSAVSLMVFLKRSPIRLLGSRLYLTNFIWINLLNPLRKVPS